MTINNIVLTNCPFYGLKSKRILKQLLKIKDNVILKDKYILSLIYPKIEKSKKPRLIEIPNTQLKIIQKRIKNILNKIVVPNYVFSGVKGKSYVDNAKFHSGEKLKNLFKIDLTAFFPSIERNTVYNFFAKDLCCSPDISKILTDMTTVDLTKLENISDEIYDFLNKKQVTSYNHLISGAPTSQILSYLVNHTMFDEMFELSKNNNIVMTIYVDDVTFSSNDKISYVFRRKILDIVKKYNYKISQSKVKMYTKSYPKLITGVIIDKDGQLKLKNSLGEKIMETYKKSKSNPQDFKLLSKLRGLLLAARQIEPKIFPSLYNYAFNQRKT